MKKISRYSKLLIIVFLIASAFPTMGSAYNQTGMTLYVDGSVGSDSNNGSSTTSAFKTIQKAVSVVQPGTTIYVRSGTYNENIVVSKTGTQSAPITLARYPGETVVINGNGTVALRNSGAIAYWVIDGFTIKSTDRYTLRLGWWGEPMTDHWTIRNNKIFGANYIMGSYHLWENNNIDGNGYTGTSGDAGISDAGDSHHNTYRNNYIHDFTAYNARGIWTQGLTHDSLIENNTITNITPNGSLGQCIDLDGYNEVEWRHTVRNNIVNGCSYVGIQLENVFDSVIENNIVINSGKAGITVINYDNNGCKTGGESNQYGDQNGDGNCQGDITNNILRQNLVTTNTSWGAGYGGIMNWYAGGLKVWGNTISSPSGVANGGINFQGTLSQTKQGSIKGNIVTQGGGTAICATDLASFVEDSNNLVYRTNNGKPYAMGGSCNTGYSLAEYQLMSGKGTNSVSANPMFVNSSSSDFHLTSSSPAIDAGISLNSTSDIEGSVRPINVTYDLGAYEFGGTPAQVSPTATIAPTNLPTQTAGNNLALGKSAMQASTYESADASRAVDGNIDGNLASNSVTHTLRDAPQAWWQVDLGAISQLQTINVYNRTDCCSERALNVYVLVSDTPFVSTSLDATRSQTGVSSYYISGIVGRPSVVNVNRTGRYVRVQLTGTEFLSLAEVQVFGANTPTAEPTSTLFKTNTPPPTIQPTNLPSATPLPTLAPTIVPTLTKTSVPTFAPTMTSTNVPNESVIQNTPVPTSIVINLPTQVSRRNLAVGKPATQSSTYLSAAASRAVDGNTDGKYANKSVTHTKYNSQAWWQVDLTEISQIQTIKVWTRTDCCQTRSTNVYVLVSDVPFISTKLTTARAQPGVSSFYIEGKVGSPSLVNINRSGRYVRVQLTKTNYLSLAEVEVFGENSSVVSPPAIVNPVVAPVNIPTLTAMPTNTPTTVPTLVPTIVPTSVPTDIPTSEPTLLPSPIPTEIVSDTSIRNLAIGKTATQVSDYEGATAEKAIDGNTDGNLANNSVTHTLRNVPMAWWQVDLGEVSQLQTINVYNRTDCCSERALDVNVLVSDTPFDSTNLYATRSQAGVSSYFVSGILGTPSVINVNRSGRYVRVQLTGTEFLSLAEVEVMGLPGVVLPDQIIIEATAIPEPTEVLVPTSEPVITEAPVLPTDMPSPSSTSMPLDPTGIPSIEPTQGQ